MGRIGHFVLFGGALTASIGTAGAQTLPPSVALIDQTIIDDVRAALRKDIVRLSVEAQNRKRPGIDQDGIAALDAEWVAERKSPEKPLISATLSSPLSTYLTRIQAHSYGVLTETMVFDANGLNVGQSTITSDFYQGDEAKYQRTYLIGPGAMFISDPEFDDDTRTWRAQLNLTVADGSGAHPIGAATFEFNLTELERRAAGR